MQSTLAKGRLGVGSDPLHHGHEAVRSLRRQMLVEMQLAEPLGGIDARDLLGRLARVEGEKDRDKSPDDMSVAVADKGQARDATAPVDACRKPDLADAALHLVGGGAMLLGQGLQPPPKLDHVAVAVLPIVEELEVGEDLLEARPARFIQRVHEINIGRNDGGCDRLPRQSWGRADWEGKGKTFPIARPWQ